jgi:polyribonucleotide nucleotidyltransferase
MFRAALAQAKQARLHILKTLGMTLPAPRQELSRYAPVIMIMQINPEKIGEVIGPGGKVINGIIAQTGGLATIDIEQDGKIFIAGPSKEITEQAYELVKQIVREFKVGEVVEGTIIKILEFGAIVDLGGGRDGMIHVSELKEGYVKKVEDVVQVGDFVKAKIVRVEDGRIGLSIKALSTSRA